MNNPEFTVDLERLDQLVARLSNLAGHLIEQLDLIDDADRSGKLWTQERVSGP